MLCEHVARIVKIAAARIEPEIPLRELGFDSVMALELRSALQGAFGMQLPATTFWNYPTVVELAAFLARKMGIPIDGEISAGPVDAPDVKADSSSVGGVSESVDSMTEEELLERETAELMSRVDAI
nr:acyl carrier protein [Streptomyces olivoverticillatus]